MLDRIDFRSLTTAAFTRMLVLPGLACLTAFAGGLIGPSVSCSAAERWTSLNGNSTVEAEFIGMWGSTVVLELPGPRRVSVNVDDLIAESRIQARRLAEEQRLKRTEMRQQILATAKEAAAPAPTPLPEPPAPPAYRPLSGSGLLAQLEWLDQQERNGHGLIAMFDSLPASYQTDLERLLRASVAKLDLQGTRLVLGSIHSIGDLVVTRQRWLFSHPRLGAIDAGSKETLKSVLLSIGGLIRDGMDPDQLKLDELATTPLRQWLVGFDERTAPHIAAMYDQFEMLGIESAAYEVTEEKDGKASVERTMGLDKQVVSAVNVDGKWMPEDLNAEKWAEVVKNWEESLAATADGSLLAGGAAQMVPLMINPILQPAVDAKSAREFHAAMDGWIAMAAPMVAQMGDLGIGGRRQGYNGGYDDMNDYYDDMEMDMDMEEEMGMEGYGGSSRPPSSRAPTMSSGRPTGSSGRPTGSSSRPTGSSSRPTGSSSRPGTSSRGPGGSSR